MEQVYEELDDAKAEIEKLKAELRGKTDSLENFKKFQNVQVSQIQEAKLKIEKLEQELLQKADEVTEAKHNCEDLKGNLTKKESIIRHLSAANDKLRVDCDDKFKKWEDEKKELVLALEEATEKAENQEQQIYVYKQEIESLKCCLSVSKRSLEVEKKSEATRELREREDTFQKLEEENRKVADQLKWKKEQFKHLEEAHEKVREQFRSSKKEWELEKFTLFDEISSLQMKLDGQIRTSENLQNQLQMCSQALAHEESRRKHLEVQVSNYKARFENVSIEYEDARFELDHFNSQRDNDIGDLRYSLKAKEAECKELKYTIGKLEQEKQELRVSLKELQKAQIQEASAAFSQSKLRSKLRNLEQIHRECASTLTTKEAEWKLQLEKLSGDLTSCQSELENKTEAIEELRMELKLLNEEMSVMLLVLKREISEARLKLANDKEEMDLTIKVREQKCSELMQQLEMKNTALVKAQEEIDLINKEREEKCSELMKQLEMINATLIRAQKEINEEREKAACVMRKVDSLSVTKEQQHSVQIELDRYKKMLEESTKCQLVLKDKILQMEIESNEKLRDVSDALDRAKTELDERIYEEKEVEFELQIWKSIVERLKDDLEENHVIRKELENSLLAQVDVSETLKQEKASLIYKVASLGQQFTTSLVSFSSQFAEKQAEINLVQNACDKITAAEILALIETEEKKLMIRELEDDIHDIEQKLKLQELKMKELTDQIETKLKSSDALYHKLKMENRNLLENVKKLSSERENLLSLIMGLDEKVCEFSTKDTQLLDMLGSIVQSFENGCPEMNLKKDDGFLTKENTNLLSPMGTKKLEAISDVRSPFKELNN
ncbi:putative basic helix loop helix protein [Senna tora]|uniref:Putative basic helix loop helix protein n=1 Tax=Senna tora TaxID=362788 RepID=A0A834WNM4_9FABA|nr:putative basic helix loop helix protein [Senna tora]